MSRPMLTRKAREKCLHAYHPADTGDPWCRDCGLMFERVLGRTSKHPDYPRTEAADREQMEREGQGRLPL